MGTQISTIDPSQLLKGSLLIQIHRGKHLNIFNSQATKVLIKIPHRTRYKSFMRAEVDKVTCINQLVGITQATTAATTRNSSILMTKNKRLAVRTTRIVPGKMSQQMPTLKAPQPGVVVAHAVAIEEGGAEWAISNLNSILIKYPHRLHNLQIIEVQILVGVLEEVAKVGKAITISMVARNLAMELVTTISTSLRSSMRNNTGSRPSILSLHMVVVDGELDEIGDITKAVLGTKATLISSSIIVEVSLGGAEAVGVVETNVATSLPIGGGAEEMAKIVSSSEGVTQSLINKFETKRIKSSRKT